MITQDFIAVQTAAYDVYEDFEDFFSNPLQVVGDVVEPSLVQRVGLRYVDLIRPGPERSIEEFLKPGLQGLKADDIGANSLLSRFEMLAQTGVGMMRIRCLQSNDGSPLPPDLRTNTLNLDATVANGLEVGEVVSILDLDHFANEPMDYELAAVVDSIGHLHDNLDQAFRAAVTQASRSTPHPSNLVRIRRIHDLARAWRRRAGRPLGKLRHESLGGQPSVVALLGAVALDDAGLLATFNALASSVPVGRSKLSQMATDAGLPATPHDEADRSFDNETLLT